MKKFNKRNILIACSLLIVIVIGIIFYLKPDYRYIVRSSLKQSFTKKDKPIKLENIKKENLVKIDLSLVEYKNNLLLINKANPLDENRELFLSEYKDSGLLMDKSIHESYYELGQALLQETGDKLLIKSSYRTREEQELLYSINKKKATLPGASEHESGLALDVYIPYFAGSSFIKSKGGQYINDNSYKFGFIIRYPTFKKRITGIGYEPWHLRYVGFPHSEIIYKNKMVLEEYIVGFEIGEFYTWGDYIISRQTQDNLYTFNYLVEIKISPDNLGNYIITGKKP